MTIENTLERIAVSLERLVDLQAGRNLLLESAALARAEVAEAADAAVEKAATRGRGRPRKTEEPKVEEVKAEEPKVEESAPAPVPKAEEPAPTPAAEETKAPAINAPTVEQLQMRAPSLAKKFGGQVSTLVKQINPAGQNISSMTDEMRVALWAALDALEAGATTDAEFG